jgi:hypothetical protein
MPDPADVTMEIGRPALPWTRPEAVEIDIPRGIVRASYPAIEGRLRAHRGGALERFRQIALAKTDEGRHSQIVNFVRRYGLLISPFSHQEPGENVGLFFVYEEPLGDYLTLSKLINSTLSLHERVHAGRPLPAEEVETVADFILHHTAVPISLRREGLDKSKAWIALWRRFDEPLPQEHRGKSGNLRKIWRDLQADRVVEVFNVWVRRGRVIPALTWHGDQLRGDQWTGAAWGALAGELQDALLGRSTYGVCAYCSKAYKAPHKRPRRSYAGKPVNPCCLEPECLRAKRRVQTARSRAKSRRTTRARARTRVLVS